LPLASDDPRIALIPQFLLMFLLWGALFFGAGVAVARLRRNKGRPSTQADR